MLEILQATFSVLAIAFFTAFCVWYGVAVLNESMHYRHPLWWVRYWAAKRATRKPEELKAWRAQADGAEFGDAKTIMEAHYKEIAAAHPPFKRWICVYCMATFVSLVVATIIAAILLPLFQQWVVLYWFSVFPFVGWIGENKA